jgi:RND superfamily putative drug exporter
MSQDLVATDGVATVTSLVSPEGDGVVPAGMRPSTQLADMADAFAEDDTGTGGTVDSEALLGDDVTDGLDTAREYLGLLGVAYPDVAAGTAYRAAVDRVDTARDDVDRVRESADVATQLRTLSRSMTSPTTAAGGDDADTGIIGDYLDELAAEFPQVRRLAAYTDATRAASSLEQKASIAAALDASSAFSALATWFDDNLTDAVLFPDSLAGTAEARERKAEVQATFDALPGDFGALSAVFADRSDDVFVPVGLSGEAGQDLRKAIDAFVSEDRTATRFYVTTSDDPYALGAFDGIRRAQEAVAAHAADFGPAAAGYLGGATADFADVQTVIGRDFERVGVITVVGVFIVLMILLRAVVAPLYLVATVLLSCATALGLSAWFFQEVQGSSGVSFYLPLLVFVLLVALGSDYNIFLMSRVREESETRPIRDGIRIASGRTGAVITSAGLILAGTFGSMATAELAVLFQVGIAVALS